MKTRFRGLRLACSAGIALTLAIGLLGTGPNDLVARTRRERARPAA